MEHEAQLFLHCRISPSLAQIPGQRVLSILHSQSRLCCVTLDMTLPLSGPQFPNL